jgi:hypothetical protein
VLECERGAPGLRVVATSDLHTDFKVNMAWVLALPAQPRGTHLIVAGDVSHSVPVVERTLVALKGKFDEVFFTVGNHELWVEARDHAGGDTHSLDKLLTLLELCDRIGVRTRPTTLTALVSAGGEAGGGDPPEEAESTVAEVVVVPLLSWYSTDLFDSPPHSAPSPWPSQPPLSDAEEHFDAQCRWPPGVGDPARPSYSLARGIAPFFASLNAAVLEEHGLGPSRPGATGGRVKSPVKRPAPTAPAAHSPGGATGPSGGSPVVTFSHFIPDGRLFPGRYDLRRVMGSQALRAQVASLAPVAHVFGHSHMNADRRLRLDDPPPQSSPPPPATAAAAATTMAATRFVQSSLGYPSERLAGKPAPGLDLALVWTPP